MKPANVDPAALVMGNTAGKPLANWDREAKRIMARERHGRVDAA